MKPLWKLLACKCFYAIEKLKCNKLWWNAMCVYLLLYDDDDDDDKDILKNITYYYYWANAAARYNIISDHKILEFYIKKKIGLPSERLHTAAVFPANH